MSEPDEGVAEVACPDCGGAILIPVHTHDDVWMPNDPSLPEVQRHVMWNPELHPTFIKREDRSTMAMTRFTVEAADRRAGLTVADLRELLDDLDEAGACGEEIVRVVVNLRGGIKTMTVEVDG